MEWIKSSRDISQYPVGADIIAIGAAVGGWGGVMQWTSKSYSPDFVVAVFKKIAFPLREKIVCSSPSSIMTMIDVRYWIEASNLKYWKPGNPNASGIYVVKSSDEITVEFFDGIRWRRLMSGMQTRKRVDFWHAILLPKDDDNVELLYRQLVRLSEAVTSAHLWFHASSVKTENPN